MTAQISPEPKATPIARPTGVLCNPNPFAPLYIIKNVFIVIVVPIKIGYVQFNQLVLKSCLKTNVLNDENIIIANNAENNGDKNHITLFHLHHQHMEMFLLVYTKLHIHFPLMLKPYLPFHLHKNV